MLAPSLPPAIAQSRPVKVLESSLQRGRLAHGILLHGDDLTTLERVALALGGALLQCATERVARHPDFFTLRPAKKARQIRIGERGSDEPNTMRRLLRDLSQTSNQGGRKVAVIYEADRMNNATANAFLKTLEEPPADTTLLLLTTRPYSLLDTIRSRTFNFRIPATALTLDHPAWVAWREAYLEWLGRIAAMKPGAEARAHAVMGAYGLIVRFTEALDVLSDEAWEGASAHLPESLDDDERAAHEVGIRKGLRNDLFRDIEETTRLFAIEQSEPGEFPAHALARLTDELERMVGLLEVNLKEDVALERFLHESLRLWNLR
jgi:DNA polymerase III subunit delta'